MSILAGSLRGAPTALSGSQRHEAWVIHFTLDSAANHQFLDLANRLGRVQSLRADVDAVHDRVATEQTVRIFEVIQTLAGRLITAIGDKPISLQQTRGTHELVRIPPEARARRRAARAQNALVQTIQLVAFFRRLQTLLLRRRRVVDQVRL